MSLGSPNVVFGVEVSTMSSPDAEISAPQNSCRCRVAGYSVEISAAN
jgi:hypothetical protein